MLLINRPTAVSQKAYGAPIDMNKGNTAELSSLLNEPMLYSGSNVIVQGRTGQVCRSSGCWLIITDGVNQLFVQFYDFTVQLPPGSPVRVQGELRMQNQVPYLAGEGLEVLR
jgi:hypothetical protein